MTLNISSFFDSALFYSISQCLARLTMWQQQVSVFGRSHYLAAAGLYIGTNVYVTTKLEPINTCNVHSHCTEKQHVSRFCLCEWSTTLIIIIIIIILSVLVCCKLFIYVFHFSIYNYYYFCNGHSPVKKHT